jgi:hypothetical protein
MPGPSQSAPGSGFGVPCAFVSSIGMASGGVGFGLPVGRPSSRDCLFLARGLSLLGS